MARTKPGTSVTLKILREGKEIEKKITIAKMEKEKLAESLPAKESQELGVNVRDIPPEEAKGLELPVDKPGVYVTQVDPSGAAGQAGVQVGDVILKLNGNLINNVKDFLKASRSIEKGRVVRIFAKRGDATLFFAFTK